MINNLLFDKYITTPHSIQSPPFAELKKYSFFLKKIKLL